MKNLSIKAKMTIWYTAMTLIIVIFAFFAFLYVGERVSTRSVKDSVKALVKEVADEIADEEELEFDEDISQAISGIYIAVYDRDGNLLAGTLPSGWEEEGDFDNKEYNTVVCGDRAYYTYDKKEKNIEDYGKVWIRGIAEINSNMTKADMEKTIFLLFPIVLLIMSGGGYLIARGSLKPLGRLNQTASSIAEGDDLSKRIPLKSNQDEIYKASVTINEMLERLESSFQREKQFTSDVSHELRTPVAVILAQCDFSLHHPQTQEEYKEALMAVQNQSTKMSELVQNLLAFTRMENLVPEQGFEEINISELLDVVCEEQEEIHEEAGITLTKDIIEDVCCVGNPALLVRVCTNLIGNAYQYNRKDGSIHVELQERNENVVIKVSDTGIGIPEDKVDQIWNRFYQVNSSRTSGNGSSGLGLSMVKWIAQYHHGHVSVESELGKGSVFVFEFPKENVHLEF